VDRISSDRRSANMAAIRGRDTGPEMAVRRILRSLGVGYRLHGRGLPGRPDIVMHGRRRVILVHGCFWHRHGGCVQAALPKTRPEFWLAKFAQTMKRDRTNTRKLREAGWKVLVIWECEIADVKIVQKRITSFLEWTRDEKACRARAPAFRLAEKAGPSRAGRGAARP
jgi:DNA mismatch endonuclease (patch repair protein)